MKKNKYIIIFTLIFLMLTVCESAFAAATVSTSLPKENIHSVDFTNVLTADDVPAGWKAEGNWNYGNADYMASTGYNDRRVYTTSEYDLSSGFVATFKFARTGNSTRLHVGNNKVMGDAKNTGYYVNINRTNSVDGVMKFYLDLYENATKVASAVFGDQWVYYGATSPMTISLTCLEDGNMSVDLIKDGIANTLCTYKTDKPISSGRFGFQALAAPLYVYSLNVDKPTSNISTDNFLLDKTFTSGDTTASLERAGWQRTTSRDAYMTFTDDGISYKKTSGYFSDSVELAMSKYVFSGDYTFSSETYKYFGDTIIKFNIDGSSYYKLTHNSKVILDKVVNGVSTNLLTKESALTKTTYCDSTTTVSLVNNSDGSLTININIKTPKDNYNVSYTDSDTPLISGMVSAAGINNGGFDFRTIKVYPTGENSDKATAYTAEYYINDEKAENISAGVVELDFPVVMLGDNMITLSALYSQNSMIACNMGTIYNYIQGRNKIFELSEYPEDAYVITYFIESFYNPTSLMNFKILN